ncbi:MAG: uracil phosphoribosyltransferase [Bacteroidetes bacterium GWF2_49_14]|nr:MAG: uracil phosphoribosyltransferase [Bacteroidetes bacterium GWF2_49_14]
MMINNLGDHNSILNQFVAEIRDEKIQSDAMRFRQNLVRIGEVIAYEISKTLSYQPREIRTPLGTTEVAVPSDTLVLATILRAGLPIHQGLLNFFDHAENAFISAYREYEKDGTFHIRFEHISSPSVQDKVVVIADPMIATGSSIILAYNALLQKGKPTHVHIASLIASKEGIDNLRKKLPMKKTTIWVAAIDDELTSKAYIVPGLGDAGDLAYGSKSSGGEEHF